MFEYYEPGEDSYTFYDVLENEVLSKMLVLDLGCSTGYLTTLLAKKNTVISSDLNLVALEQLENKGCAVKMDLLNGYNQHKLDCIVFNPPYVPDFDCKILGGGRFGRVIIDRFIAEVEVKLFYLLIIEANKPLEVIKSIEERNYKVDVIKIRKIVGETIIILKAEKLSII